MPIILRFVAPTKFLISGTPFKGKANGPSKPTSLVKFSSKFHGARLFFLAVKGVSQSSLCRFLCKATEESLEVQISLVVQL